MTTLLFRKEDLPRSRPRIHRGHAIDCGNSDEGAPTWARLRCANCHHVWEVHTSASITELKRGLPCPTCNGDPVDAGHNGYDVTDRIPLTRAQLEKQRPR